MPNKHALMYEGQVFTFLRNCFHITSKQSLTVIPFLFRAVTVKPIGNLSSNLLIGGVVAIFFMTSGS